ncbi:MAG TPA: MGMT family protein [Candidatus Nanoarchaeia archaeon]|nr:DNA base-flipping protein [uncultured archaeon]
MSKEERVYQLVSQIPAGYVSTYGTIAKLAGVNNPRLVGRILHQNPDHAKIPCHRIVNRKGEVSASYAFGGLGAQKKLLQIEGVEITEDKVPQSYFWEFPLTHQK